MTVEFFYDDEREYQFVFVESEESMRVGEEYAGIENVSTGQSAISLPVASRQASTLEDGKARISGAEEAETDPSGRVSSPGNC